MQYLYYLLVRLGSGGGAAHTEFSTETVIRAQEVLLPTAVVVVDPC